MIVIKLMLLLKVKFLSFKVLLMMDCELMKLLNVGINVILFLCLEIDLSEFICFILLF